MGKNLLLLKGSIAMIFNHSKTATIHILIFGEFNVKESWKGDMFTLYGP
jgi:hypothetical protein